MKELKRKFTDIIFAVFVLLLLAAAGIALYGNRIQADIVSECSNITTNGSIPASCDGNNVVIDGGNKTPNITVITSGIHTYNNLTVKGGATLTHNALVAGTDFNTENSELINDGQNKKVDLIIKGDLTLESGGSINVDGKGYPGGGDNDPNHNYCGGVANSGKGFGPAGGDGACKVISRPIYIKAAGGGGNGGSGGSGVKVSYDLAGGIVNNVPTDITETSFLPGSGGGGGHWGDGGWASWARAKGGIGGGRIHLKVYGTLKISDESGISANGVYGIMTNKTLTAVISVLTPGGGAGGTVWLEVNDINFSGSNASALRATKTCLWDSPTTLADYPSGLNNSSNGVINTVGFDSIILKNITANGGNGLYYTNNAYGGAGGGGRIYVVDLPSPPESRKVKVKVLWSENGQSKTFEMNEILGEIK